MQKLEGVNISDLSAEEKRKVRAIVADYLQWLTDANLEADGGDTIDEVMQLFKALGGEVADYNPEE